MSQLRDPVSIQDDILPWAASCPPMMSLAHSSQHRTTFMVWGKEADCRGTGLVSLNSGGRDRGMTSSWPAWVD